MLFRPSGVPLAVESIIAVLLVAANASAAELVVADSFNVDLKPGQIVQAEERLSLTSGQRLLLISHDGRAIRLIGPYEGVPGATESVEWPSLVAALAALRTEDGARLTEAATCRLIKS